MDIEETRFLLNLIIAQRLPGTYLEIGTAAGGTLCQMMLCFSTHNRPKFVVVDPMRYFPRQLEIIQRNLQSHFLDPLQVEFRVMASSQAFTLAAERGERFDLILIDGDHNIESVMLDLRWTELLNDRGIVCIHDYAPRFIGVKFAVNRFLRRNPAFTVLGRQGSLLAVRKEGSTGSELTRMDLTDRMYARSVGFPLYISHQGVRHLRRFRRKLFSFVDDVVTGFNANRYVNHEMRKLRAGIPHPTLGTHTKTDGLLEFNALVQAGLKPQHCVVDFGCGTLRLGRHLIAFLDPGNYWGLDITERFLKLGISALGPAALSKIKLSHLHTISRSALKLAAAARPDVVLVAGVLQCLPPRKMRQVIRDLASMCCPSTQILITLLESESTKRLGRFAFRHSLKEVSLAAERAALEVQILRQGIEPQLIRGGIPADARGQPGMLRGTLLLLRRLNGDISGALDTTMLSSPVELQEPAE
jgi:SAM-dependent methyltransferase